MVTGCTQHSISNKTGMYPCLLEKAFFETLQVVGAQGRDSDQRGDGQTTGDARWGGCLATEGPWPPRASQEFLGVNSSVLSPLLGTGSLLCGRVPHLGRVGRQGLCSWGLCRAAWTLGGGCSTPTPGALWALRNQVGWASGPWKRWGGT